ncbi:hypothetical protein AB2G98_25200 (plasmid) [Escherichia coli]
MRAETITSANARLVDFQATLPLAQICGWRRSGICRWNALCYASQNNQCRTEPQILW